MFPLFIQAWRSWKSARSVAVLAIAALAIGIGSATAIYSVVQAVLLNPLPWDHSERFFQAFGAWHPHLDFWTTFSYPDFQDYARATTTTEALGCYSDGDMNLTFGHMPLHVFGAEVTPSLVRSMKVQLLLGRWSGDSPADSKTAVLSESLWRRFGSNPQILGKALSVNSANYTVAGVMPRWFHFPVGRSDVDVWIPLRAEELLSETRAHHNLQCVAKLKSGFTLEQATTDINRTLHRLQHEYPGQNEPDVILYRPLLDFTVENVRPSLLALLIAAAALLLVACANVASILLARSVARSRETGVRVALGARSWQLALQYFFESLLVSIAATVLGALLALVLVRTVLSIAQDQLPRADLIAFSAPVLLFAVGLAFVCAVFFSLSPLFGRERIAPRDVLVEGSRSTSSPRTRHLLRAFVIFQIAVAFALCTVAGEFLLRVNELLHRSPGFDAANLTVADISVSAHSFKSPASRIAYEDRLLQSVKHASGIENAGFIDLFPLVDWGDNTLVEVDGRPKPTIAHDPVVEVRIVSPDYFQTMRIPLLRGRLLTAGDRQGTLIPAIINETLARYYWPHGNPIGSGFRMEPDRQNHYSIVGVVADVRNKLLSDPPAPEMYLSYTAFSPEHLSWAIRSHLDPAVLSSELRHAIASVDPDRALFNTRPIQGVLERSLSRSRLIAIMVTFFASAAILLCILGVFGVVSYGVRQRTGEIGTRMALGAAPRDMLRLFLIDGAKMLGYGLAIGLALVLIVTRASPSRELQDAAYVPPFILAALLIAALTLAACWFPAWRATTLSPLVAIRSDLHPSWARIPLRYRDLTERAGQAEHQRASRSTMSNELLAAIVDSSRQADSFPAAMQAALETLCREMNTTAAYLFERKTLEDEFTLTSACPSHATGKLPAQAILITRLQNYSSALPTGPDDLKVARRWAAEHAPHHLPEIETLQRLNAHLAAPVLAKTTMIGVLLLAAPVGRAAYSPEEGRALRAAAAQLALLIENGRMTDRIVEQEYLRRELALASEVQKRLFPQEAFEDAAIQLTGMCLPARGVGGDYYDFLDLGAGQIGVALADVAGKGIAAALLMSIVQASLRSLAGNNGASLGDLAGRMNRLLHGSTGVSSYATFFYAQVDEQRRTMRYVNAGHNPPFLLCRARPANDAVEELSTGGMIIGMFANAQYEEGSIALHSGDVLMLFTDGVSEAHDPEEREFGEARLKDLLRRTAHRPLYEMSAAIFNELKAWMQNAPQHDDLTFVLMKVR